MVEIHSPSLPDRRNGVRTWRSAVSAGPIKSFENNSSCWHTRKKYSSFYNDFEESHWGGYDLPGGVEPPLSEVEPLGGWFPVRKKSNYGWILGDCERLRWLKSGNLNSRIDWTFRGINPRSGWTLGRWMLKNIATLGGLSILKVSYWGCWYLWELSPEGICDNDKVEYFVRWSPWKTTLGD